MTELDKIIQELKDLHPKIYTTAFEKGISYYENGYCFQQMSDIEEKGCVYQEDTKEYYAHLHGVYDGYNYAEEENYKVKID